MFSYWEKTTFLQKSNYLIIGAGFTGLWTALEIRKKHPNASVTIVERGILPTGASTKNAGFSCFGSPTELINDAKVNGKEAMWDITFKRYEGLRKIHNTFSYTAIDYKNTSGFECLTTKDSALVTDALNWLNEEFYSLTGNKNCFVIDDHTHGLKNFDVIVKNKLEGCLNPAKLVKALYYLAYDKNVTILNNVNVEKVDIENKNVTTNIGALEAEKIIICNNAFAKNILPELQVIPQRGQVLITKPIENLQLNGCYHYDEGYYYFRNVGNQLLIGGARNKNFEAEQTDQIETTELIVNELVAFVDKHIVSKEEIEIEHKWSGIMGFTNNKKPIVKAINENVYCAIGLSGMGVALAPILAEEVVSLIA